MSTEKDTENLHKVIRNLNEFSETVSLARVKFSKLFSDVLHIPLNDGESILKLKMFGSLYEDDFASHLKHLTEMCSTLETADESPITLKRFKKKKNRSLFKGMMSLKKIDRIDSGVVKESTQQISQLIELASELKKIKEEQKNAFEGSRQEGKKGTDFERAIISKIKNFLAEEAKEALFDNELETDPAILLAHLKDTENSLQDVCKVTPRYEEVLQTVLDRMEKVKSEDNQNAIVEYISGMKDGVKEIVHECDRISKQRL